MGHPVYMSQIGVTMNLTRDLLSVLLPGRGLLLLVVVVLEPHLVLALRPRLLHLVLQVPHQLKKKKKKKVLLQVSYNLLLLPVSN